MIKTVRRLCNYQLDENELDKLIGDASVKAVESEGALAEGMAGKLTEISGVGYKSACSILATIGVWLEEEGVA